MIHIQLLYKLNRSLSKAPRAANKVSLIIFRTYKKQATSSRNNNIKNRSIEQKSLQVPNQKIFRTDSSFTRKVKNDNISTDVTITTNSISKIQNNVKTMDNTVYKSEEITDKSTINNNSQTGHISQEIDNKQIPFVPTIKSTISTDTTVCTVNKRITEIRDIKVNYMVKLDNSHLFCECSKGLFFDKINIKSKGGCVLCFLFDKNNKLKNKINQEIIQIDVKTPRAFENKFNEKIRYSATIRKISQINWMEQDSYIIYMKTLLKEMTDIFDQFSNNTLYTKDTYFKLINDYYLKLYPTIKNHSPEENLRLFDKINPLLKFNYDCIQLRNCIYKKTKTKRLIVFIPYLLSKLKEEESNNDIILLDSYEANKILLHSFNSSTHNEIKKKVKSYLKTLLITDNSIMMSVHKMVKNELISINFSVLMVFMYKTQPSKLGFDVSFYKWFYQRTRKLFDMFTIYKYMIRNLTEDKLLLLNSDRMNTINQKKFVWDLKNVDINKLQEFVSWNVKKDHNVMYNVVQNIANMDGSQNNLEEKDILLLKMFFIERIICINSRPLKRASELNSHALISACVNDITADSLLYKARSFKLNDDIPVFFDKQLLSYLKNICLKLYILAEYINSSNESAERFDAWSSDIKEWFEKHCTYHIISSNVLNGNGVLSKKVASKILLSLQQLNDYVILYVSNILIEK